MMQLQIQSFINVLTLDLNDLGNLMIHSCPLNPRYLSDALIELIRDIDVPSIIHTDSMWIIEECILRSFNMHHFIEIPLQFRSILIGSDMEKPRNLWNKTDRLKR